MRVRLIDLQGQPAAGVKVFVCRLGSQGSGSAQPVFYEALIDAAGGSAGSLPRSGLFQVQAYQAKTTEGEPPPLRLVEPSANLPFWPAEMTTDAQGRFTLRGVGRGQAVGLQVRDSRFALQALALLPQPKDRPAEITLALAPARILEGTVVDADTGQPVPHARLHVPAPGDGFGTTGLFDAFNTGEVDWQGRRLTGHRQYLYFRVIDSTNGDQLPALDVRADKDGRYRLPLFLADSYRIQVSAPKGQSYFSVSRTITWPRAAARQAVKVDLPRGVWLHGRVLESAGHKPVANARVDFWASGLKPPEGIRYPHTTTTAKDGVFRALLPPGSWHLLVNAPASTYVSQKIAVARLIGNQSLRVSVANGSVITVHPGDQKQFFYPDGWAALDLKPRADPQEAAIKLRRVMVQGKLVDPDGKPVARAVLFYRHPLPASSPVQATPAYHTHLNAVAGWAAPASAAPPEMSPLEVRAGRFAFPVRDLEARYPLFFLDARNNLGAVAEVSVKEALARQPTLRMTACGSARARFLDDRGKPLVNYQPQLWLLLPPGPHAVLGGLRATALGPNGMMLANNLAFSPDGATLTGMRSVYLLHGSGRDGPPAAFDRVWLGSADPLHYGKGPVTDAQGNVTLPALLSGATYRLSHPNGQAKDFKVKAGQTLDLGTVTLKMPPRPVPSKAHSYQPIPLLKPLPATPRK